MKVWLVTFRHYEDDTVAGIGDSFTAAIKIANRHYKVGRPSDTADLEFPDYFPNNRGSDVFWAEIGAGRGYSTETYYLEEMSVESV